MSGHSGHVNAIGTGPALSVPWAASDADGPRFKQCVTISKRYPGLTGNARQTMVCNGDLLCPDDVRLMMFGEGIRHLLARHKLNRETYEMVNDTDEMMIFAHGLIEGVRGQAWALPVPNMPVLFQPHLPREPCRCNIRSTQAQLHQRLRQATHCTGNGSHIIPSDSTRQCVGLCQGTASFVLPGRAYIIP